MMTKTAALQAFMSGFNCPAYEENAVPKDAEFPYITYESTVSSNSDVVLIAMSVWDRTTEWTGVNAIADNISASIGTAKVLSCDCGGIILRKGSPFSQAMGDSVDDMVKRRYLNIEATYVTIK